MNLAYQAMLFAKEAHKEQKRKYTGQPYFDHLAEVAGIVSSVVTKGQITAGGIDTIIAVAFLHDCMEDQDVSWTDLDSAFGPTVADGVQMLSDLEEGNRATRKALSRERLANAPGWVQTIKCADLISNTSSIVQHDPNFAKVYLEEKRLLLEVLTKADRDLHKMACEMVKGDK